jgi:hypothetical protein
VPLLSPLACTAVSIGTAAASIIWRKIKIKFKAFKIKLVGQIYGNIVKTI